MTMDDDALRASYAEVADEYVARIHGELAHKPLDRELLAAFAERVRDKGPCYDVGCGPGHVTTFLAEHGADAIGVDLSPDLIERARRLDPARTFLVGDMRALPIADGAAAGVVAMYAIVHFTPAELPAVFRELARVLAPGARLLVSFHIGTDRVHLDEWWGKRVSIDFQFFAAEAVIAAMEGAGLALVERVEREPYPDVEVATRRAYLVAAR
jgi:SAM-dependent methyltransferase